MKNEGNPLALAVALFLIIVGLVLLVAALATEGL